MRKKKLYALTSNETRFKSQLLTRINRIKYV